MECKTKPSPSEESETALGNDLLPEMKSIAAFWGMSQRKAYH